jgi:serine/threonine-protein kinase
VLADFGVARALADARTGARLTATGVAVGTPGYMSPEQLAGDAIDARAEIYALGVVGYEMLSGKPPFEGPTAQAVLTAHLTTPPLPLTEVRPEVPPQVSNAISRALSKNPEERFVTALEFAEALGGSPGTGSAPRVAGASRRRAGLVVGGLVLLGAIAALALSTRGSRIPAGLLAELRTAADSGRLDQLATLLDSAGAQVTDRAVAGFVAPHAGTLRVTSEPRGAEVTIARASPLAGFASRGYRAIGSTPVSSRSCWPATASWVPW